MQLLPLGGAGEIGASCFYLNIDGAGIILDSGIHPQKSGLNALPNFDLLKDVEVDTVLLSHAHQDHIGSLPYLVRRHPYVRIISTPQTRAIAELTLHNAVAILQEQLAGDTHLSPFSHDEVDLLIQSIEWRVYNEKFEIHGFRRRTTTPIKTHFFDAGHILGSAGILTEFDGRKIVYTGNINLDAQAIQQAADIESLECDTLIIECTQGNTDSSLLPHWRNESIRMAQRANEILENGGSILIPAFALGKMQEILCTLWKLMMKGSLTEVDIYTGGVGVKINSVYEKNRYVVPTIDPEFRLSDIPQKDIFELEKNGGIPPRPSIVIASSGMMMEKTTSYRLAPRWLAEKKNAIFVVGYMDPQTPGFRVARAEKGEKIRLTDFSHDQIVQCSIDNFRFTSHARRERLLEIVQKTKPNRVILVHGDQTSIDWMGNSILQLLPGVKVFSAQIGHWIEES